MLGSSFITLCKVLILTTFLISQSKAETATSGNLLPNAGDGVNTNAQNSNSTIDGIDSATGFTLNGITDYSSNYNELEAQGTGTVSASGSLVNIQTTTQSGNSFTTTETSLDGGVTLNAITEVQNCEWSGSSYQCGQATSGRDSYSTTIKILDENDNVLSITTMTRNNDAGYRANTHTYTDTATYTDTGSRKWDWQWQGIDGNSPNSTSPVGPNLLGASLTATLLDITYTPISEETTEQLEETNELLEEAQEDLAEKLEELKEINLEQLEELQFEELTMLLPEVEIEEIKEIKMEEIAVVFEENFKQILKEENLIEEFETALIEENITEEEFFEEVSSMMEEELITMAPPKEEEINMVQPKEETNEEIIEEAPKKEEVIEEKPTKTETKEEGEPNATSTTEKPETTNTQEAVESNEEESETGQKDEDVPTEREMDENEETEGQTEKESPGEVVEDKTNLSNEDRSVDSKVSGITEKVAKIIKKLEAKLKRVDDKLNATAYVLAVGLQSTQPDIGEYINKSIPKGPNLIGVPNDDFFDKINILAQQQIYKDATLAAYSNNDPIAVRNRLLNEIDVKKSKLKAEIAALRSIN